MKFLNSLKFVPYLLLMVNDVMADHIVGADMAIVSINKSNANFRIILNMYIDHSTQPDPQKEKEKLIQIYRKSDGKFMTTITLYGYAYQEEHLTYTNRKCAEKFNIHVYKQHLEREVVLKITDYNDPQGYILVLDRCCRGEFTANIIDGINTALAITMEIPSLKDYPTYSSLEFSTPNGDYACKGKPFQINFAVINSVNKSIKYKLTESLAGFTKNGSYALNNPPAYMKAQPPVNWSSGNSGLNPIPSSKNLTIDQSGLLTVTPTQNGIYCFAVIVEEYIGNTKIGHITRDYILIVVDCPINKPPQPIIRYQGAVTQDLILCPGRNAILETETNADWNFRWQRNNSNIANENTNKIAVQDTGTYRVIKSLKSDCSDESVSETVRVTFANGASILKIKANSTEACGGDKIKLELEDPNQIADWYLASTFLKKDKSIEVDKSGDYIAKTSSGSSTCTSSQDNILIKIRPKPVVSLPDTKYDICTGDKIDLITSNNSDYIYQWYKGNTLISGATSSTLQVTEIGNYHVKVNYPTIICESVSQVYKVVLNSTCGGISESKIFIPTSFTPNADGHNDLLDIINIDKFPESEVCIYNRWGEMIFYSKGYINKWDGTLNSKRVPSDTYSFVIKMYFYGKPDIKGSFLLLY